MKWINKIKNMFNQINKKENKESYISSLKLKLTKDLDIDLFFDMPDINGKTPAEMTELAESCGKFLVYVSDSHLIKKDIMTFLTEKALKTRDPEYKLLLDNIIIFWNIYTKEYKKEIKSAIKDDSPLIRPISVFSVK